MRGKRDGKREEVRLPLFFWFGTLGGGSDPSVCVGGRVLGGWSWGRRDKDGLVLR